MVTPVKLIITEHGDSSVGIPSQDFVVDFPLCKEDSDQESLDYFKKAILDVYKEFAEMNVTADYDFELGE